MYTRDTRRNAAFAILEGLSIDSRTIGELDSIEWKISQSVTKETVQCIEVNIYLKKKMLNRYSCFVRFKDLWSRCTLQFSVR